MSKLIDDLVYDREEVQIGHYWYVAKPINKRTFGYRIREAWKVLCGKVETFHYKEDEING